MMKSKLLAAFGLLLLVSNVVSAQPFTTVQLPTVQRFSVTTSALVPDRGSAYLGGVNSSYQSSSQRGTPFFPSSRNRSGGATASGVSVSAYIHDFEEMDAAVLAKARRLRAGQPRQASQVCRPQRTSNPMSRDSEMRAITHAKERAQLAYAKESYDLAQKLIAKGKVAPARSLLRNAHKRGDAKLKLRIEQQLAELNRIPVRSRVASRP